MITGSSGLTLSASATKAAISKPPVPGNVSSIEIVSLPRSTVSLRWQDSTRSLSSSKQRRVSPALLKYLSGQLIEIHDIEMHAKLRPVDVGD